MDPATMGLIGSLGSAVVSPAVGALVNFFTQKRTEPPPYQVPIQAPPPYQGNMQPSQPLSQLVSMLSQLDRGY